MMSAPKLATYPRNPEIGRFNLQGRIPYAHGKKTPTPSFYPSLVRMPRASFLPFPCPDFHGEKTPSHFHSGWATAKLGIDLGGVFSKAPELGRKQEHCSATSTLSPSHAISLRRQIPLPDVYPLE